MSYDMIADCLAYSGHTDKLAVGMHKSILALLTEGKVEIYWDNAENEIYISLPNEDLLKLEST